ncbi:hypothetical protein ACFQFQ_07690 [Sulfitobacter porphyrae]|uniref:Uncharacterized protein n=1 Tax=Sulfitobacter porphyrae TaxID=1246864 RepID=A0ABW2B113_9RHOB
MMPEGFALLPVISDARQIRHNIGLLYGPELALRAAQRVPEVESCRSWHGEGNARRYLALAICAATGVALVLAPLWTLTVALLWAFVTLMLSTGLKIAAFAAQLSHFLADRPPDHPAACTPFRLPRVSILVPLLKETEIAGALIARLSRLTYPKSLLNVILVLEEEDQLTRKTIARTKLPGWITVIEVPTGNGLTTKPRALNYALDFCEEASSASGMPRMSRSPTRSKRW